ncbi:MULTISPECIES: DNA-protecting protein DprA [Tenebrionibacter/Tenebrionicola group]|uniref:DNA-protecting protein DprA n=2 Tax=Tenebrionibacter/Tenebrionicola group TaxID=2969848 RepID=A0A8K0V543_9ENTR|nr:MULTISPECIES: DNA-protecting protein DprA [Tenebrionibacter/Tenebrionicola group]MBK4716966.1 DNA-protecting protein DprA [Tenebrionibacter intestinalis]MBV4413267.1 DNA-protecting protein DprA [Tenebrionicola larvae]MBV5097505.1 DNA-protecting protein DprA [Tenebrionicola larvae]
MRSEEFWLRLMAVQGLCGEKMQKAAEQHIDVGCNVASSLIFAKLNENQQKQFYAVCETALERAERWLSQEGNHLLTLKDDNYPVALRAIPWFPGALFVRGNIDLLSTVQLAVVGSRTHTWYGERWGRIFTQALAAAGLTITSGLALGIDGVAHRAALSARGKTVAVLGSGMAALHPRRHRQLAEDIVNGGGAVISEFTLETKPWPANFPRRNRIISGLSRGVLVVEATLRSGSLITARHALEQGRDVFAIPGAVGAPGSEGPHWLMKQGAVPATSPDDILEYWQNELSGSGNGAGNVNNSPDPEEPPLPFAGLLANVGDEVTPVDVVAERAGQPVPLTVAQLLELELAGWIAAVPGGYVRLRRAGHVRRTNVFI